MIIVSDASPINNLAAISHLHHLQQLLINEAGFWVADSLYDRVLQLVDEDVREL